MSTSFVRSFAEIGLQDVAQVGGKNSSLGEMVRELGPLGVRTVNGFALTAQAYRATLDDAGIWPRLRDLMDGIDPADVADLARRAAAARALVAGCPLPLQVVADTRAALSALVAEYGQGISLAVRSSATAEDLPTASFAGQHESYLNVEGEEELLSAIRRCFASLFTDRAIRYRIDHGFDHLKVFNSVGVMKMVRSDLACSGVIFTLDTESGFPDVVYITAAYGLGETVVQGIVDPDEYLVFKPTYRAGCRNVLRHVCGRKEIKLVYGSGEGSATQTLPTPEADRQRFCLSDTDILSLAGQALAIEDHYSRRAGEWRPMDIEWAKDGVDGEIYIIQARPETVVSQRNRQVLTTYVIEGAPTPLITGHAVGAGIAKGRARIITDVRELASFEDNEILVAEATSPDWGTVMKRAAGIVTDKGGRTCHAAIVARESGIPAVVGTERGSQVIRTGDLLTISCAEGETGRVYPGAAVFHAEQIDLTAMPRPRTKIMLNVGDPEQAFRLAALPNDGVGLARMEFIISEFIKAHPMALAHPDRVTDPAERDRISGLCSRSESPARFFVEQLSEGVGMIAAAFYPKPVIVRFSDFKSNEYAALLGGRSFEPAESNPMIGFRGASRYTHPAYADAFALECAAMKRVREDMGLTNLRLMIPFCRRLDEADAVLAAMSRNGLERGANGLEVYVMCEIPNNVVLVDDFARRFDGFSIGSNDLTQLVLGVDRDSEIVAFDFDERDPGVKAMLRQAIEGARRNDRHCGICGQAPSDYPDMAEYLVELGIDSISLNPDSVLRTTRRILDVEKKRL